MSIERRICQDVIIKMILKIPKENAELIKDLQWNLKDARYKAPEETLQWQRTHQTLIKHLSKPTKDWEFEVLSIFTTQPINDLKKIFYK